MAHCHQHPLPPSKTVFLLLPERKGATTVCIFGFHPTPYNTAPGGHAQLKWDKMGNWQGDTAIWRLVTRNTYDQLHTYPGRPRAISLPFGFPKFVAEKGEEEGRTGGLEQQYKILTVSPRPNPTMLSRERRAVF